MSFRILGRKSSILPFVGSLILAFSLLIGTGLVPTSTVHAEAVNCDNNAVVYCGASSVSALQSKYNNGDTVNKAYSIQDVYHAFNIAPSDISAMSNDSVEGYVTKTGDVYATINGKNTLVATNAITAGRQPIGNETPSHYGQTTFYKRAPSVSFQDSQLTAMVVMKNGVFQFAVLHSCGNPIIATAKTTPPPAPTPFYSCVNLTGAILDQNTMKYSFTATANFGGGATLTSADFVLGDGTKQPGIKAASGAKSVSTVYQYSKAGTYNASAILHFNVSGKDVTAAACAASVTPTTPPTPECKPGVPVGSPECTPCQYDTSLPSNSPDCKPPTPPSLPNTGAGDVIALFAVVVVGGFLVYRQIIFRKHRAAFLAAQNGSSLPLSDPLNETPDESQQIAAREMHRRHNTFRRRRPF